MEQDLIGFRVVLIGFNEDLFGFASHLFRYAENLIGLTQNSPCIIDLFCFRMRFIHIKSIPLEGKMIGPDLGVFLAGLLK